MLIPGMYLVSTECVESQVACRVNTIDPVKNVCDKNVYADNTAYRLAA